MVCGAKMGIEGITICRSGRLACESCRYLAEVGLTEKIWRLHLSTLFTSFLLI